ncbi:MAG TPA: phosphatase PAP2 family protein [Gemmatimonadaceae bacterium]|nr:phosphatase PAP2 family protein [Gemmatimonadaceae bacterium]
MRARVGAASILIAISVALPAAAYAQASGSATFFRASDLALWTGFSIGSIGLSRADPAIAQYFQRPEHQKNSRMRSVAEAFTHVQETTLTIGGLLTYGVARLAGSRDVEAVALHATEAIVASSITSQVIRGPLGRARPKDARPIFEDQYEFHWFDGFTHFQYRAFPSIHSASAFAVATAIVTETHYRSPGSTWYVAPIAYVFAAGPGYARMYLGQHWASDIVMGAFVGTFYGQRIVSYAHAHPTNKVDHFFLGSATPGLTVLPQRGGVSVKYGLIF